MDLEKSTKLGDKEYINDCNMISTKWLTKYFIEIFHIPVFYNKKWVCCPACVTQWLSIEL